MLLEESKTIPTSKCSLQGGGGGGGPNTKQNYEIQKRFPTRQDNVKVISEVS